MDKQQLELSEMELTAEELNDVNGGVKNGQTAGFRAFVVGILQGYMEAGGHGTIIFN